MSVSGLARGRVGAHGGLDQPQRLDQLAAQRAQDRAAIEGGEVARIELEDGAIELLGLADLARRFELERTHELRAYVGRRTAFSERLGHVLDDGSTFTGRRGTDVAANHRRAMPG